MKAHRMTSTVLAATVLALVLPALALAVPGALPTDTFPDAFLQRGYDAARTGDLPGTGPKEHEVALTLQLPGKVASEPATPLILDGLIHVLLTAYDPAIHDASPPEGRTETGVVRVDPDTAAVETVVALDPPHAPGSALASDGERLLVAEADRLAAYDLDGRQVWSWPYPRLVEGVPDGAVRTACVAPAVHDGSVLLTCTQDVDDGDVVGRPQQSWVRAPRPPVSFVARLDAADGTEAWVTSTDRDPHAETALTSPWACTWAPVGHRAVRLTVVADSHVLVVHGQEPGLIQEGRWSGQYAVEALGLADGTRRWMTCLAPLAYTLGTSPAGNGAGFGPPALTGDADRAYVLQDELLVLDVETGATVRRIHPGGSPPDLGAPPAGAGGLSEPGGLALSRSVLYGSAFSDVFRIDPETGETDWRVADPAEEMDGPAVPLVADGVVYVSADEGLFAFDAETGVKRWAHGLPFGCGSGPGAPEGCRFPGMALAEGRIAAATADGLLTVLGRTELSIRPVADVTDRWPAPGETVTVDLSGTAPGAAGGPLEYRADWGDDVDTAWQDDPVFDHAYAESGTQVARFTVRATDAEGNASQQSVQVVTFDVGGTPPAAEGVLQSAFSAENEERTFFLLGLAVTGAVGALGYTRVLRRRRRLEEMLASVDRTYDRKKDDPARCEEALEERRLRAHGLLTEGKLDEGHFAVLERRIDRYARKVRLSVVDERFAFLPFGMVQTLRRMLADGHINAWERTHFLEALDGDEVLTDGQKEQVRDLIEDWFHRDEGGAA